MKTPKHRTLLFHGLAHRPRSSRFQPFVLFLLLSFILHPSAFSSVPSIINYQGQLLNNAGTPLTTGMYLLEFRIWDNPTATATSNLLWGRSFPVYVVSDGLFNVMLSDSGNTTGAPIPPANALTQVFSADTRYLGITIASNTSGSVASPVEISPRQRLSGVAYALRTLYATHAVEAQNALSVSNVAHTVNSDKLGNTNAAEFMLLSRFPGAQNPAKLLVWDGTNATAINAYLNNNVLVAQYDLQPVSLITAGGVIQPSAGSNTTQGIEFPQNPGGGTDDRAWIKYYARTGEDCTLSFGILNDIYDSIVFGISGDIRLYSSLNSGVIIHGPMTATAPMNIVSAWQLKTSWDKTGDGRIHSGTASSDGLLIVQMRAAASAITVNGVEFDVSCDEDDDINFGIYTFPVAKGEAWSVDYYVRGDDDESYCRVYWRSLGIGG